jgi:hypothetical protein
MGDKKQKEALMKKVKQVLVVGACVLFVILMILSGMSSHWLNIFTVVKPGDSVVVDYTMYDINGNPVLTSNQQTYTASATKGAEILYSKQLTMIAGQNLTKTIYPVLIYTSSTGETREYALFSVEYNAINQALTGMRAGDQKRILVTWPTQNPPNATFTNDELTQKGINNLTEGETLMLAFSENATATNSTMYPRIAEITHKTSDGAIVDWGYPSVDISIISINAKNY